MPSDIPDAPEVGKRISHEVYGSGTVKASGPAIVLVRFDLYGEKELSWFFAHAKVAILPDPPAPTELAVPPQYMRRLRDLLTDLEGDGYQVRVFDQLLYASSVDSAVEIESAP